MAYNPCFISFRHFGDKISDAFIQQFEECLTAELKPLIGKTPFIDHKRMHPGYSLNATIAQELCQSVCMVVIWTPQYFNEEHIWCATEFKAMQGLEAQRLLLLPKEERNKRLIIPVIYRGSKYYPDDLSDTLYLNFEKFTLHETEMIKNGFYANEIKNVAEYIHDRILAFKKISISPWGKCEDFILPNKEETLAFLQEKNTTQKFPFR